MWNLVDFKIFNTATAIITSFIVEVVNKMPD